METRARFVLIGAFTLIGFLGLLGFLLWFGKAQSDRQFAYYDVLFDSVAGISRGSDVQFAGLRVGQVTSLTLDRDQPGKVRLRMEVDARAPVKTDSVVTLEQQGVTGVATAAIAAGSPAAPLAREAVEGVPTLPAGRSTLQSLTQDAPALIAQALDATTKVNEMLGDQNRARVETILANLETASGQLESSMADVSGAVEALKGLSDAVAPLSERAGTVLDNADAAIADLRALKEPAGGVLDRAQGALDGVKPALDDLAQSSAQLRETVERVAPKAEALMTGWTETGARASARLDEAQALIASLRRSADAFDGETMSRLNAALSRVATDLPQITADLRGASQQAGEAFGALGRVVRSADKPLSDFFRSGLPQFTRLADDARGLIRNLDGVATRLNRDPARTLLNSDTPEFRR